MADYAVFVEGIDTSKLADRLSGSIETAAYRAINRTADRTRTDSAHRIREQVAFSASYLNPSGGRLTVRKKAAKGDLEAVIRGRFAPTSLARFVRGGARRGKGVTVVVKPGMATFMRRAFLIRLPQGNTLTETKSNLGLAIRLKKGETLRNKRIARRLSSGLYLLYGPSVDQVFRTVSEDVSPEAAANLEREFLRLLEL